VIDVGDRITPLSLQAPFGRFRILLNEREGPLSHDHSLPCRNIAGCLHGSDARPSRSMDGPGEARGGEADVLTVLSVLIMGPRRSGIGRQAFGHLQDSFYIQTYRREIDL
jgi:hypothetical protein